MCKPWLRHTGKPTEVHKVIAPTGKIFFYVQPDMG